MIDKTILYAENIYLDESNLINMDRYINKETGEIQSYYSGSIGNGINTIKVRYYPDSNRLRLIGRLVNTIDTYNRVYNYDDYMIKRKDPLIKNNSGIDSIIIATNKELNSYLNTNNLDIKEFYITRLEICFNVWLDDNLVDDYIDMFTAIHKRKNKKGYKLEKDRKIYSKEYKDKFGSYYLRTMGDYQKGKRTNRCINFYNKLNQLKKQQQKGKVNLTKREKSLCKNLLRLEVQLFYQPLYRALGRKKERKFNKVLNLPFCYDILKKEYEFFLGSTKLDYYSYDAAKKIAKESTLLTDKERKNLINDMVKRYRNNNWRKQSTIRRYNKKWERLGIHPVFIPAKIVKEKNLNYLENPIKILDRKLNYYLENRIESNHFILK